MREGNVVTNPVVSFLKSTHLIILVLIGIVTPVLTVSAAYWGLKLQVSDQDRAISDRVSRIETETAKVYVDKDTFQKLADEVKSTHDDVIEIKTILKSRPR